MKAIKIIFTVVCLLSLMACNTNSSKESVRKPPLSSDQLIQLDKQLLRHESDQIDRYIRLKGLAMKETPTGLRYVITHHGKGAKALTGRIAIIRYRLTLLDGKLIASSKQNGLMSFEIGHGGVEKGLEEGILLLKVGDEAKFILPSHLAFGLSGDGYKIPPQSPLIYEVDLVKINIKK